MHNVDVARRTFSRTDALRHGLWIALVPASWLLPLTLALSGELGMDSAHAYWAVWRNGLYQVVPGGQDAYNYSPVFAQAIYPLTLLPWPVFLGLWMAGIAAVLLWLLWPLPAKWRWLVYLVLLAPAVGIGNIQVFIAAACVVGLRYPAAWAFPALTKVTPALGPVWFLARREWRPLLVSAMATLFVAGVSFVAAPHLWIRWISFLETSPVPPTQAYLPPLWLRLLIAVLLVAWGARKDRRWTLAVGIALAVPLWSANLILFGAALPRLLEGDPRASGAPEDDSRSVPTGGSAPQSSLEDARE